MAWPPPRASAQSLLRASSATAQLSASPRSPAAHQKCLPAHSHVPSSIAAAPSPESPRDKSTNRAPPLPPPAARDSAPPRNPPSATLAPAQIAPPKPHTPPASPPSSTPVPARHATPAAD